MKRGTLNWMLHKEVVPLVWKLFRQGSCWIAEDVHQMMYVFRCAVDVLQPVSCECAAAC
jgi:hypothetical protein